MSLSIKSNNSFATFAAVFLSYSNDIAYVFTLSLAASTVVNSALIFLTFSVASSSIIRAFSFTLSALSFFSLNIFIVPVTVCSNLSIVSNCIIAYCLFFGSFILSFTASFAFFIFSTISLLILHPSFDFCSAFSAALNHLLIASKAIADKSFSFFTLDKKISSLFLTFLIYICCSNLLFILPVSTLASVAVLFTDNAFFFSCSARFFNTSTSSIIFFRISFNFTISVIFSPILVTFNDIASASANF